jgi:hypothetical protein
VAPYLRRWALLTVGALLLASAVNLVVDPYGAYRLVVVEGFNARKPGASAQGPLVKAYGVERERPRGLVLGNSRAEVGFDPGHPAWPESSRPVYNAALPGTGTREGLRYLQHALAGSPLGTVVLGLDFMDFLVAPEAPPRESGGSQLERRLRVLDTGEPNPLRLLQRALDTRVTLLSLDALLSAVGTVAAARDGLAADLTDRGFNPMRDYERIAAQEGYWALFAQRDTENLKAYRQRPRNLFRVGSRSSGPLEELRAIVRTCARAGTDLHLVIYPYHANLLETFRVTGLWEPFEEWKRALVEVVEDEASPRVALWDFSGYNPVTTEPVPPPGDTGTVLRWYWEAGHFKKALGDRVLGRILGLPGYTPSETGSGELGVRLTAADLEVHLARIRGEQAAYLGRPGQTPGDVAISAARADRGLPPP